MTEEKNWDQSLHWYRLAGNHLAEANLNMGVVLRDELNQPEAALDSFLRGARMGDVSCVLEAAQMYQVQFQYEAAVKILQGSQQNARAKMRLASFYELGRGVERSVDRALELLSEAVAGLCDVCVTFKKGYAKILALAVGNTEEASDARAFYGNLLVRMGRFKGVLATLMISVPVTNTKLSLLRCRGCIGRSQESSACVVHSGTSLFGYGRCRECDTCCECSATRCCFG